ncbi:MAG: PilZ domain-containing protein [Acidobacteria bacterium]|nr:PilZ domain-containing protein [Acidobacteriota bacterium]
MNQRRESRFQTDQPVAVTVFGTPDIHMCARVRNASGRGLGLEVAEPLATGTALKVTLEDSILLGEVIYSREEGGMWYAGIELEHALSGLAELAAALEGFREEPSGGQRQNPMQDAHHKYGK